MNITNQVVILSAEKEGSSNNVFRTADLRKLLDGTGLSFKRAKGVYKGKEEESFVVVLKSEEDLYTLKDLAFNTFEQESILYQDANGEASLIFSDNSTERLGRLQQVSEITAREKDGYTLMEGKYYTTIPRPSLTF